MNEIKDMVVPMLQGIQTELKVLRARADTNAEDMAEVKDDLDVMKGYITYHMGLTSQNQSDITDLRKDVTELKRRMAALEGRS
jgi:polyhydroxyalkanoate synthesis regulator phasin